MKRRKNPDESLRDLERRARQGDREAAVKILVDRTRRGLPLIRVMAAADLGCSEAQEAYEAIMGRKLTKMSFTDQISQAYSNLPAPVVFGILIELAREVLQIRRGPFYRQYMRGIDRLEPYMSMDGFDSNQGTALHQLATEIINTNPGDMLGIALYTLAFNRLTHRPGNLEGPVMSTTDFTNCLQGESRDAARQWVKERLIQELLA